MVLEIDKIYSDIRRVRTMLKEQDTQQYLYAKNISYKEHTSIIGVIYPNKFTYALGAIATAFSMQYFALHFNDNGLSVIGLNNTTGKPEENAFLFLPKEEISSVQFHKKLMSYELEIVTSKGVLTFKVNKTMVGASWQKQNLATLLDNLSM